MEPTVGSKDYCENFAFLFITYIQRQNFLGTDIKLYGHCFYAFFTVEQSYNSTQLSRKQPMHKFVHSETRTWMNAESFKLTCVENIQSIWTSVSAILNSKSYQDRSFTKISIYLTLLQKISIYLKRFTFLKIQQRVQNVKYKNKCKYYHVNNTKRLNQ